MRIPVIALFVLLIVYPCRAQQQGIVATSDNTVSVTAAGNDVLQYVAGKSIALPPPDTTGGMPLMAALALRHSMRNYSSAALPMPMLSNLLWAANGVNRRGEGKRTAATARNWQNLEVYVATVWGLFRYDAAGHTLVPVVSTDLRGATGTQRFVADAPVNLVYVSDWSAQPTVDEGDRQLYDGAHAGMVAQNVYLYAASAGLGTVVRASIDRPALARAMGLKPTQRVVLAQSVGLPAQ
jgi:hypothetical protein